MTSYVSHVFISVEALSTCTQIFLKPGFSAFVLKVKSHPYKFYKRFPSKLKTRDTMNSLSRACQYIMQWHNHTPQSYVGQSEAWKKAQISVFSVYVLSTLQTECLNIFTLTKVLQKVQCQTGLDSGSLGFSMSSPFPFTISEPPVIRLSLNEWAVHCSLACRKEYQAV